MNRSNWLTDWTASVRSLPRRARRPRLLLAIPGFLALLLVFSSVAVASGGPDGYLILGPNFQIRFVGASSPPVDWGNSGTGSFTNPASCGTAPSGYQFVQVAGSGGVFDCGLKPISSSVPSVPLAPVLTPLAGTEGLVLGKNAVFIVDALGSDTTACPGKGDPTVFTGQGSETNDGDLNTFTYNTGSVPTKDEIANAYAIAP